jgi:hypothetical protein
MAFLASERTGCTSGDLGKALKGRSKRYHTQTGFPGLDTRPTAANNCVRVKRIPVSNAFPFIKAGFVGSPHRRMLRRTVRVVAR